MLTQKLRNIYNIRTYERSDFMDILIVEDDLAQLDGIEAILLEKYDNMNCIKADTYKRQSK